MKSEKSLLYIHDSCPHPNKTGSDLVIYRHLKKAENSGWKINIILPKSSFPVENRVALPDTWNIYPVPNPFGIIQLWMINRLRGMVYVYYYLTSLLFIKQCRSKTIVSYFWGYNFSGFARFVARLTGKKLIYFYHDRFQHFFPTENKEKLKKFEEDNAKQATTILTVSEKLIFSEQTAFKHRVLLPIPQGDVIEGKNIKGKIWLYSGAVYPSQHQFFLSIAEVLKEQGFSLTIISNFTKEEELIYKKHSNILLVTRFATNREALNYISENASVIITGYPEDVSKMPWIVDCFPSKFLEYCFFNIPVIAFSPEKTAFYKWCKANSFKNIYSEYSQKVILKIVKRFTKKDFFQSSLENQKGVRKEFFLPVVIQKIFEISL